MERPWIADYHVKWVQWAIAFTKRKIGGWKDGEWLDFLSDLHQFCYGGGIAAVDPHSIVGGYVSREDMEKKVTKLSAANLQLEFGAFLRRLIKNIREDYPVTFVAGMDQTDQPKGFPMLFCIEEKEPFVLQIYGGGIWNDSRFALGAHIAGSRLPAERFRVCPECLAIFLTKRKPVASKTYYCTPQCSGRVASRNYAQRKEKERIRSKKRYREKVLGPKRGS